MRERSGSIGSERTKRRAAAHAISVACVLAIALVCLGCGSSSSGGSEVVDSGPPEASGSLAVDASAIADAQPGAGETDAWLATDAIAVDTASDAALQPVEASTDAAIDSSDASDASTAFLGSDASDAGSSCSPNATIAAAGNYIASDGTQYWLRKTATAATFTVVPPPPADAGDAAVPALLPQLSRIKSVCPQWLGLANTNGSFARLDWASVSTGLLICSRRAASLDAASTLPAPDPSNTTAGCDGSAWLAVTPVSP